jgi:hypothetical protein
MTRSNYTDEDIKKGLHLQKARRNYLLSLDAVQDYLHTPEGSTAEAIPRRLVVALVDAAEELIRCEGAVLAVIERDRQKAAMVQYVEDVTASMGADAYRRDLAEREAVKWG